MIVTSTINISLHNPLDPLPSLLPNATLAYKQSQFVTNLPHKFEKTTQVRTRRGLFMQMGTFFKKKKLNVHTF